MYRDDIQSHGYNVQVSNISQKLIKKVFVRTKDNDNLSNQIFFLSFILSMADRAALITSESVEEVSISVKVGRAFSPYLAMSLTAKTHFSISIEKRALSRKDSSFSG
jgi:hypothetical protein